MAPCDLHRRVLEVSPSLPKAFLGKQAANLRCWYSKSPSTTGTLFVWTPKVSSLNLCQIIGSASRSLTPHQPLNCCQESSGHHVAVIIPSMISFHPKGLDSTVAFDHRFISRSLRAGLHPRLLLCIRAFRKTTALGCPVYRY